MELKIADSWKNILEKEFENPYFKDLITFVKREYEKGACFPEKELIFSAFNLCPLETLKVVVLGQDPYHDNHQANGLCFSVKEGVKHPPSLKNIFKEMTADVQKELPQNGNLESWAKQGVLLLNATLTVKAHEAGSHQNQGWERFTDAVITQISKEKEHVVFLLWGKFAKSKMKLIDTKKHTIFTAPHPSPLGAWRGWFGSKHFSKTNTYLKSVGEKQIIW
jgi:uracil-DNA glycosylase